MRLAIVWRSRDIFSVVPRNVLVAAAGAGAAAAAGCGRGRWLGSRLLGSLGLLLRSLSGGEYVLLADPSAYSRAVERRELDAVLFGEFAHQRCHVGGVRVASYRSRGSSSWGCRTVLFRPGVFFCGGRSDFGLLLRLWLGLSRWPGLRFWPAFWLGLRCCSALGLGRWLRLRRGRCRGSGFANDR